MTMLTRALFLSLAFVAGIAAAAPAVTASQSTVFSGTSATVALPAGAVGETIVVVVTAGGVSKDAHVFSTGDAGWAADGRKYAKLTIMRFVKVSDGTETTLNVNIPIAVDGQAVALRVSGASVITSTAHQPATQPSLLSDPPSVSTGAGAQDVLAVAVTTYVGGVPAAIPAGYGFPIDAGGNLTLSFKSVVASIENPGPYSLAVVAQNLAATFLIY